MKPPWLCPECNQSFGRHWNAARHVETQHPKSKSIPVRATDMAMKYCPQCGKKL